ncbi:hypothetical protein J4417_05080 [Candidatus Woesearchaeota archaeon]|nr:hypothetical protein [Candidatus Woesearchaeota archaeon]
METKNFSECEDEIKLEERLEHEFVQQPDGRLFIRRCYMCQSVEIGDKIVPPGEYEKVLNNLAQEHTIVLPGKPLPVYPVHVDFTDTLLSRECLTHQMIGQPKYYQKDGFTLLGRYSPEDVQKMRVYQAIPREKCKS